MHSFLALSILSLALPTPPGAQEWPRFRGPNGAGASASTGLPETFGKEKNLRWRAPLVAGHSSPVLGTGTVFLTGADEEGLVVLSLAADTGAVRWEQRLDRVHEQEVFAANGSATPSPTTDGRNVFAFFPELGLISFDAEGGERWMLPLGPFVSFYGMAASPILAGNTLVLLCDQQQGSFLLGVDAATGKQRWRTERAGLIESWTTPVLYPSAAPESVLVLGTFFVCAYSPATGAEQWRVGSVGYTPVCSPVLWERPEGALFFASVPFHAEGGPMPSFESMASESDKDKDGKLAKAELAGSDMGPHFGWADANKDDFIDAREWKFICDGMSSQDYGLVALQLGGKEAKEAKELWRAKRGLPAIASPLLLDGILYLVKSGGMLTTIDALSGKELGFQRLEEAGGEYDASPVAADGKLFLASQEGRVTVLAAGPEPKVLSSCDLGETIHATPAIGAGALFVRTDAALYCFGAKL
jgi:outer membrane protein assembly factor BamB